jgi:hypothetical protein
MYDFVMTSNVKKTKHLKVRLLRGIELQASMEDDLLSLADDETGGEARWNRPRKASRA